MPRVTSLTLAAFALYLATLHPGLPGGDSGEFIAVAHELGIAHPPGYPLYTLIGHVWIRLFGFLDPALAMNLLSAVAQALAVGVLAVTVTRLTGSPLAGLTAGGVWAVTAPVWKMAVVAEVFALNALLAAVLLAAFVAVAQNRTSAAYAAIAFLCGTLLAHHHTLVLLAAPAFVTATLLMLEQRRATFLAPRAIGAGLLGASPILALPILARDEPTLAWGDPTTLEGLLHHLLRGDYGTFSLDPEAAALVADTPHPWLWLRSIPVESGWPAAVLALIGAIVLTRRAIRGEDRPLALTLAGFLALQLLFFTRVGFPSTPLYMGVVERFWILPAMIVALLAGVAIARLADGRAARPTATGTYAMRTATRLALRTVAALTIAWPALAHFDHADNSGNRFVDDLAHNVLASMPRHGALFVQGDLLHNALAVEHVVRGTRPDVAWADQELMTYDWAVERARRRDPNLLPDPLGARDRYDGDDPTSWNVHWFDHLIDDRPVAIVGVKEDSYTARYAMVPRGLVSQVVSLDRVPDLHDQAETATAILEHTRWRSWFRPQDPRGFEVGARWRLADFATRASLLLCQPSTYEWSERSHPGLAVLEAFVERYAASVGHRASSGAELERRGSAPQLDPASRTQLLRATGLVSALHPTLRDPERSKTLLRAFLIEEPSGPRADEARRVLGSLP